MMMDFIQNPNAFFMAFKVYQKAKVKLLERKTHLEVKLELVSLGLVLQEEGVLQMLAIFQLEVDLSLVVDDLLVKVGLDEFRLV